MAAQDSIVREESPAFDNEALIGMGSVSAWQCSVIEGPERSWSVRIGTDGNVELSPGTTFPEAARIFWESVQIEGKSVYQRLADAEARIRELEGK